MTQITSECEEHKEKLIVLNVVKQLQEVCDQNLLAQEIAGLFAELPQLSSVEDYCDQIAIYPNLVLPADQ